MVIFSTVLTAAEDSLNGFPPLPFPYDIGGERKEKRGNRGKGGVGREDA